MQIINTQIKGGMWHGNLSGAGNAQPQVQVTHLGRTIDGLIWERDTANDLWRLSVPIPPEMVEDGVQTCVITDARGKTLGSFTLVCGEPLADDLRAEIALLRSELALLQTAFRRHCSET